MKSEDVKFGDEVKVVSGFFEGLCGRLIDVWDGPTPSFTLQVDGVEKVQRLLAKDFELISRRP